MRKRLASPDPSRTRTFPCYGAVIRSYISYLKSGHIENPGFAKLEAIARAMGFPPALWLGGGGGSLVPNAALAAALEDDTARDILGEVLRLRLRDRCRLLGLARQIAPASDDRSG